MTAGVRKPHRWWGQLVCLDMDELHVRAAVPRGASSRGQSRGGRWRCDAVVPASLGEAASRGDLGGAARSEPQPGCGDLQPVRGWDVRDAVQPALQPAGVPSDRDRPGPRPADMWGAGGISGAWARGYDDA